MKTSIEILKAHQSWRTHQCDSDGIEGCVKAECNMPITTPSELTKAIEDVIADAERYKKICDMDFKKFMLIPLCFVPCFDLLRCCEFCVYVREAF